MDNILLIITLSFLLATTPFLAKLFRLPITIVEIIGGVVAGMAGLIGHNTFFELIAEVGFLYLMFLAGLEINIRSIQEIPRTIMRRGVVYHVLLYLITALLVLLFRLPLVFLVVIPLISIGVVMALTKEFDKRKEPWLKLSLELGVMGELISIVALTFAAGVMTHGVSLEFAGVMVTLLVVLLVVGGLFSLFRILFWWFPEIKIWLMPYSDNQAQDVRLSFALFFVLISVMLLLELELVLGAFLAGMLISSFFEHKEELPEKLSALGFGFLVPLFFIYIGSTISAEDLLMQGIWSKVALVVGLMFLIRLLASLVFTGHLGLRGVLFFALSQGMPLTLLIAAATVAYNAHSIDRLHYTAFVVAGVFEVLVAILSIKLLAWISQRFPKLRIRKLHEED